MSDKRNDPSSLYDEDFMKKREEMFGTNSESQDVDSGRHEEDDDFFPDEEESTDVFEEKGGLFSKFKRPSKSKKKARKEEIEDIGDGYDIFELEDIDSGRQADDEDSTGNDGSTDENLDDINALLESVGIKPIDHNEAEEKEEAVKSFKKVKDKIMAEATADNHDAAVEEPEEASPTEKEKTKYFSLDKKDVGTNTVSSTKTAEEKTIVNDPVINTETTASGDQPDGQLILDGYVDEQKPDRVSEKKVEADLKATRKNLIDNFRVLAKPETDEPILERNDSGKRIDSIPDTVDVSKGEDIFDAVDKAGKKKKTSFLKISENVFKNSSQKARKNVKKQQLLSASELSKTLKADIKKLALNEKILLALTVVSLVLSVLYSAYTPGGALEFLYGSGARVYTAINLVLFIAAAVFSRDIIADAFANIKQLRLNGASCALIMTVFVLIHSIASLITGMTELTGTVIYIPCSLFALLAVSESRRMRFTTMNKTVCMLAKAGPLHALQPVENSADAAALAHGIDDNGEPIIIYGADAELPKDFEELFAPSRKSEKFYSYCCVAVLAAGFLFSLAQSVLTKNVQSFATGLVGCICLCFPIMKELVLEYIRSDINTKAGANGVAAFSFENSEKVGSANAIAVDADEIFEGKISKFRLVPGGHMALSDAVVYAASTLKETDCLIKDAFDDFIKESGIKLPGAEDIQYEEKLGYACWIAGRRVLVGNREMLVQHSIDAPTEEEERSYSKNKSVMYVVVEGMIAATFIVTYPVLAKAKGSIRQFSKTGLVLMVNCCDPCLTEKYIAKRLSTEEAAIKLIGTKGAQIIKDYQNNKSIRQDTGLLCTLRSKSVLAVVDAAWRLYSGERSATILSAVAALINFVLLVVFTLLKVSSVVGCLTAIALQAIWAAAICFLVEKLHK